MRRALGLLGLALALPWVACDDRTVTLSDAHTTSLTSSTSSGGTAGSTASVTSNSASSTYQVATGGSGNPGSTGFVPHAVTGTTMPHPFGAGGADDMTESTNWGADSDGSGGMPIGAASNGGGNEGGQGPDCEDSQCRTCGYARVNCDAPTLECLDTESWLQKCSKCAQCSVGTACFQGFKCRPTCIDGDCLSAGEYCDLESNTCVHCLGNEDCATFGGVCLAGECAECAVNDDCQNPERPYCIAGECRECISSTDCEGGNCDLSNRCIECFDDGQCRDESRPFCNLNTCTECRAEQGCDDDEFCSSFTFTCTPRN